MDMISYNMATGKFKKGGPHGKRKIIIQRVPSEFS